MPNYSTSEVALKLAKRQYLEAYQAHIGKFKTQIKSGRYTPELLFAQKQIRSLYNKLYSEFGMLFIYAISQDIDNQNSNFRKSH